MHPSLKYFFVNYYTNHIHPPLYFMVLRFFLVSMDLLSTVNQNLAITFTLALKFVENFYTLFQLKLVNAAELIGFYVPNRFIDDYKTYDEASLRIISALSLAAMNFFIFDFFKKRGLIFFGAALMFLLGLNYKLIYYAHEARPYGMFILLSVLVLIEVFNLSQSKPKPFSFRNYRKLLVLNVLLLLTHYYGVFLVLYQITVFLIFSKQRRKVIPYVVPAVVLYGAAMYLLLGERDTRNISYLTHMNSDSFIMLYRSVFTYLFPNRVLPVALVVFAIKMFRQTPGLLDRIVLQAGLFCILVIAFIFTASQIRPIFDLRHVVFLIPFLLIVYVGLIFSLFESVFSFVKKANIRKIATFAGFSLIMSIFIRYEYLQLFGVSAYYKNFKEYSLRNAYEAIAKDAPADAIKPYILEEYMPEIAEFYEHRFRIHLISGLYPNLPVETKKLQLQTMLKKANPDFQSTFYFIKVSHKNVNDSAEIEQIENYSKTLIFQKDRITAYKFTKQN